VNVPSDAAGLVTSPAMLADPLYLLADPGARNAPGRVEIGGADTNTGSPHGSKVRAVAVGLAAGFVLEGDKLSCNPSDIVEQWRSLGCLADALPVGLMSGTVRGGRRSQGDLVGVVEDVEREGRKNGTGIVFEFSDVRRNVKSRMRKVEAIRKLIDDVGSKLDISGGRPGSQVEDHAEKHEENGAHSMHGNVGDKRGGCYGVDGIGRDV